MPIKLSFNLLIYSIVFLVGTLNYALMLGTLHRVTGAYPFLAAIDLLRSEASFFLFVAFLASCYLLPSSSALFIRRVLVAVLTLATLLLAHMAAVLAQATSEAGPMHKVLFYVNYIKSDWLTDKVFEVLILYAFPALLLVLLLVVYYLCFKSELDGPYWKQKFRRHLCLALFFLFLGFFPPFQQQMPHSLSHNALLYLVKRGYFPQKDIYQYDRKAQYPRWEIKDKAVVNKKNIVLVILESTQYKAIQIGDKKQFPNLTPNLDVLSKSSVVFEQAYGSVPHTSKALVGIHCGILPVLDLPIFESVYGVPTNCLPELLEAQSYKTVFMQGATAKYENRKELLKQFAYQEAYSAEDFSNDIAQRSNPLGFEDMALLMKAGEWLDNKQGAGKQESFLMSLLTLTTHHPYEPPTGFKKEHYLEDDLENSYLNAIRYTDHFIGRLIKLFKEKGLYSNTVFVFVSDHGEAFGEHGELLHNNVAYNEVAHIFFMIHDGSGQLEARREKNTVSQLQILPSVLDLLSLPLDNNLLPKSALKETGKAFGSCYERLMCFFYSDNDYKYIFNFREKVPELFDIKNDYTEMFNLAEQEPQRVAAMHQELMTYYNHHQSVMHTYYLQQNPEYETQIGKTVLYSLRDMKESVAALFENTQKKEK